MSLIDQLRQAADTVPPSHQPTASEVIKLLGAWLTYAEHGQNFLKAAEQGADEVAKLIAGVEGEPAPKVEAPAGAPAAAPASTAAPSSELTQVLDGQRELSQQLSNLVAVLSRTTGTVEHQAG